MSIKGFKEELSWAMDKELWVNILHHYIKIIHDFTFAVPSFRYLNNPLVVTEMLSLLLTYCSHSYSPIFIFLLRGVLITW